MKKETLARAKELEKDIQQMESALSYYKRGKWSNWDWQNDRASSFHFEFCKNWSHRDVDMQSLPTWLNKPLMEVVERELQRTKARLSALTDDSEEGAEAEVTDDQTEEMPADIEDEKPTKKRIGFWRFLFTLVFVGLIMLCALQFKLIRDYQQSEADWVGLSKLWREKLDTCMNRNERIYQQLYEFQDIRIQQLKEQKE